MICRTCGIVLPWDGASEIRNCTICRKPFSTTADDVFRDGKFGICKEKREGQYQLAVDIENCILNNESLLAEGGTGIGKSYGYLVPGILSGRRMVIATAKKTLQNQLFDKDLPTLRDKMPYVAAAFKDDEEEEGTIETLDPETQNRFHYINVKGKANYLCPDLIANAIAKSPYPEEKKKALVARLDQIIYGVKYGDLHKWVERTDFLELSELFADLSIENCPNRACKFECRPNPKKYNIIVTNHHVLAYQLRFGERILGKFDILVVDEAHHFEDSIRSAFTDTVGVNYFKKSLRILREDNDLEQMLDELSRHSAAKLIGILKVLQDRLSELAVYAREYMDGLSHVIDQDKLREVASVLLKDYQSCLIEAGKVFKEAIGEFRARDGTYSAGHVAHGASRLQKMLTRIESLTLMVLALQQPDPEKQFVLLYEERNGDASLIRTPIEVGPLVKDRLLTIPVKVFVSATLAVSGNFEYFRERLGLQEVPAKEAFYLSPFDNKVQARLYTPRETYGTPIPNPSDAEHKEDWYSAISKEILRLCRYSDGDAFVLFTARTDLREVASRTMSYFDQYGLNLLVQQDEGAEDLLRRYRETDKSVLFGLKSFWEGVDIAGEKLRVVIIPKLPFPNQSDAVIKELVKRAGKEWFNKVYVPKMIFDLRQGVGRLIRSTTDRGIIAILDTRLWTSTSNAQTHATKWEALEKKVKAGKPYGLAGYGKMTVLSLGFENVVDNFNGAVNFLKGC